MTAALSTLMLPDGSPSRASSAPTGTGFFSAYCNALLNGNRAICLAFNDPKYNQSPYSRTVVIGE
jgi:hypothetical protein